ncbi:MAG TPA: gluconate:H+ symporter [Ohtaekwangia sp.]|uniref:gluconate:H+ symporter n=1 Tax=Ohtaekwangia sp. TaxID=2066019 RepID=UPI002F93F7CE
MIIVLFCILLLVILLWQFKVNKVVSTLSTVLVTALYFTLRIFRIVGDTGDHPLLTIFFCIVLLIVMISMFKINPFLAFLVVSALAGALLGIPIATITTSIQKGIGDMLGSLVIVIACGAMLGKLVADSGAAQQIASYMVKLFGERYIQWALMFTGFIIGIPLFYNVGFVLVVPLIFSVALRYKLPAVYIGLPMLASLSVTHGFLPPHPSPTALVAQFHANIGTTLLYGVMIGLPTVIIAGPIFSKTLKKINPPAPKIFENAADVAPEKLPGLGISIFSSLLPVILLAVTALLASRVTNESIQAIMKFVSDPAMVMIISLAVATFTLGTGQGMEMQKVMNIYGEAVKDIAMILLIMGGAGALKQILIDSGVSSQIAVLLSGLDIHPLVLGWTIACLIRVCVGSATVAGLTAAGIIAPLLSTMNVDPNLMVLSIGAGSLMFSHVNDTGFWLYKEYFNLSIRQTIQSWSLMETIVSVCGLIGVMIIHYLQ